MPKRPAGSASALAPAILNGLPWDFATFDQTINRVHRLTSVDPVDIYVAVTCCSDRSDDFTQGASLDQKIRNLLRENGQRASLALDGALPTHHDETDHECTLDFSQTHLYLQMSSHSNYPLREVFFDNTWVQQLREH